MAEGIFAFFNFGEAETQPVFTSLSHTFDLPYLNWNSRLPTSSRSTGLEVNLRPPLHEAVADVIMVKGWRNVSFIYDQPEGLLLSVFTSFASGT